MKLFFHCMRGYMCIILYKFLLIQNHSSNSPSTDILETYNKSSGFFVILSADIKYTMVHFGVVIFAGLL